MQYYLVLGGTLNTIYNYNLTYNMQWLAAIWGGYCSSCPMLLQYRIIIIWIDIMMASASNAPILKPSVKFNFVHLGREPGLRLIYIFTKNWILW